MAPQYFERVERIGALSARPDRTTGMRRLLLPSDEFVLVDDDAPVKLGKPRYVSSRARSSS
ncbi:hypothetical protein [Lentzea sp. NPDC092896]|uniref:hypothetical protein n=1 Tax=Lentzea sp. NPDC092896 TaxID=3364127 RepID=UPI00381F09BB